MSVIIYHNPRCSKSRQVLEILRERNIEPEIVEYLKTPPSREKLTEILRLLELEPRQLMRTGESVHQDLNLGDISLDDEHLLDTMIENPILIERPIVLVNEKAVIGRPPHRVLEIL